MSNNSNARSQQALPQYVHPAAHNQVAVSANTSFAHQKTELRKRNDNFAHPASGEAGSFLGLDSASSSQAQSMK